MSTTWRETLDSDSDDLRRENRRYITCSCADRMCGALDCRTCHPENFSNGTYVEENEQ